MNNDYDTYDAAVVIAENEEQARDIHPGGYGKVDWSEEDKYTSWAYKREDVEVTFLGVFGQTNEQVPENMTVLASFNAG